ncbi:MAG: photosystem II protein Psb27 [Synechococcales cyanobacterium RM1_1_8]|nr:photosystem II protein Psb27 [Synechococcales cyanobacterium RM1_1_8]
MKRYFARLLAMVLAAVISLTMAAGPSLAASSAMTGNYPEDTLMVVEALRQAVDLPGDAPDKAELQATARGLINDFAARYRRDRKVASLPSFTTMQTALNALAGHYSSYPNRPLPDKLKARLNKEFKRVELSIKRGN